MSHPYQMTVCLFIVEEEEMLKEDRWQRKKFANGYIYMTTFDRKAKKENDNQHVS